MKRISIAAASAILLLGSCEEFQPVLTVEYGKPAPYEVYGGQANCTIAQLVSAYKHGSPFDMGDGKVIAGRVSTTDQPGNFYKSFYIQDDTGGIEVKIGKNGLYNDYKEGQTVYVECDGLCLGEYGYKDGANGMVQIGFNGEGTDYETSYLELPFIIDTHVFRGDPSDIEKVTPVVLTEAQLPKSSDSQKTNSNLGKLVTLKGLKYGGIDSYSNARTEVFVLLYLDSNQDKKLSANRIFVSGEGYGVTTWAMSKEKMTSYLCSGIWDSILIGNANDQNYGSVGDKKGDGSYPGIEKTAASVSQYFTMGGTNIAIRTSGYSKFADAEIDPAVLSGEKTIDVTGVLTLYQGSIQIVVNQLSDIKVNE